MPNISRQPRPFVFMRILSRILPGIAIVSGQIFVCGGEVDSKILANGEVSEIYRDSSE